MSQRTNTYNYLYLEYGDKWYPLFDKQNMLTSENQLQALFKFVGPGILSGWEVYKLSDYRTNQLALINAYLTNYESELGQRLAYLNLNFTRETSTNKRYCEVATTSNITLSNLQTIDGVSLVDGDRVLVRLQTDPSQNGVYIVKDSASWIRATELNNSADYNDNFLVYVKGGNNSTQTLWLATWTPDSAETTFTLGTSNLYFFNAFEQCILVTPGTGIVSTFSAKTEKYNYFRYTAFNTYFVWAEPSICLQSEGICAITSPQNPDEEYYLQNDAIYLAEASTTQRIDSDYLITQNAYVIDEIVYSDSRNEVKNLSGQFQQALRKAFYKHVHSGTEGNPSKIDLSSRVVLDALPLDSNNQLNYASNIFKIQSNPNFNPVPSSGTATTIGYFGLPEVRLNDVKLDSSQYNLNLSGSTISLKNNLDSTDRLQIYLPKSPQKKLLPISLSESNKSYGSLLTGALESGASIFLTDGTTTSITDSNTNTTTTYYNLFIWSDTDYIPAKVYINGALIDSDYYEINPYAGELILKSSLPDIESYTYSDLYVVAEKIGIQIEGKLPGSRLKNIDAASFNAGTIDQKRIVNLDHIGINRYKNQATLVPSLRLFAEGNHTYFYPEIPNSDLQNISELYYINKSLNVENGKFLAGNKRGLFSSIDFSSGSYQTGWNIDKGRVSFFLDNILHPEGTNYFKTTYALTKEGRVWNTIDFGDNWTLVKNPIDTSLPNPILSTAFYLSTDREEIYNSAGRFTGYKYSYFSYMGTDDGLYTAQIADKLTENDWAWSKVKNIFNQSGVALTSLAPITAVNEISTRRTKTLEGSAPQVSYDRTVYASAAVGNSGLYYGGLGSLTRVFTQPVKGVYWIKDGTTGINKNDLIWWTDQDVYITHTAEYVETSDETTSYTYWNHPLTGAITTKPVKAATTVKLSATYNSGTSPHTLTFNPFDEETLGLVSVSTGSTIVDGLNTKFTDYSGAGVSIGIGFTSGATVTTWYSIDSIYSDSKIFLDNNFAGSSVASTSYVMLYPKTAFNVDGYTYSSTGTGQSVLIKNQYNPVHNGVYYVSTLGSSSANWVLSRSAIAASSAGENISVINGTKNSDSIWFVDKNSGSITFGTSELNFYITKYKIFSASGLGGTITSITFRNYTGSNDYIIGHTKGIGLATDTTGPGVNPSSRNLYWDSSLQGEVNTVYSVAASNSGFGLIYAGTNRGVYVSTDYIWNETYINPESNYPWTRSYDAFRANDEVSIFNAQDSIQEFNFNKYYQYQLIKLDATADYGKSFTYERDYRIFYVKPWTATNAKVIVYIGKKPSTVPYLLYPELGKIEFTSSLKASQINNVFITIIREGAFLYNTGETYHEEVVRDLVADSLPITTLSKANAPSETVFYTKQPISETSLTILQFKVPKSNPVVSEQVIVNIVYDDRTKTYTNNIIPRASSYTFPVNTEVYAVRTKKYLGIQDYISKKQTNQTYYFNSINVANTSDIIMKLGDGNQTYFDPYPTVSIKAIEKETGLKKLIFTNDIANDNFDTTASTNSDYIGLIPSIDDRPDSPRAVYAIYNPSFLGNKMYVGTDKGLWEYSNNWDIISHLGGSSRVYYIKSISSSLNIGTDNGLWSGNTDDDIWSLNPSFTQSQFDFINGSWFDGTFEAYAKEDGVSFVWVPKGATQFQSDHVTLVDKYRANGLYKDKFIKITTDSQGNAKQTETDALYVCAENGLFAVTNGANAGTKLTAFLTGREVFGGKVSGYKYYKIFRALSTPPSSKAPVPMFILTNNGVLKVRNWRWLDPADAATPDFIIEKTFLEGLSCHCYALDTVESPDGIAPGKSIIYIGTNNGVYRSLDEGNTFEKCERINGGQTAVYDLKVFTSSSSGYRVVLAGTEFGLWYSINQGDTWYDPGYETDDIPLTVNFSGRPTNNVNLSETLTSGGTLAQTFKTSTGQTLVDKAAAYLDVKTFLQSDVRYDTSYANNTIRGYLYSVNNGGVPESVLATSSTIYNPSDLTYQSFVNFDFNYSCAIGTTYAFVVTENVTSGGISLLEWTKSSRYNAYTNGKSWAYTGIWDDVQSASHIDLFFKVYFTNALTPIDTIIPVGSYSSLGTTTKNWNLGESSGVIVKDDGSLTTDIKFAMSMVYDDSASIKSSIGSTQYELTIKDFFTTLSTRTKKYISGLGSTLDTNYFDFWQFGTSIQEKTGTGYTNSLTELSKNILSLKQKGTKSELLETVGISVVGLSPQSISEAILKNDDETNNISRVNKVVSYLSQNNSLNLNDLRDWYSTTSKKQINLTKWSGSATTSLTVYLSKSSTGGTYTWSSSDYPYVEVNVSGTARTNNYSISPSLGRVIFNSGYGMTSGDSLNVYLRQDWDGNASGIKISDTARTELIRKWADTYKPLSFIFADGDNISTDLADDVVTSANAAWNDKGVNLNTFGFGRAHDPVNLQTLSVKTNGKHFDILNGSDNGDLENSLNSFLQGGDNDAFGASWSRTLEYDEPTYIKSIHSSFSAASGSTVSVKFRWAKDRQNYSSWINLVSGVGYTFKKEVTNIEYSISMLEGWSGTAIIRPQVSSLYQVVTTPSVKTLVTEPYNVKGSIFEYNLTSNISIPENAKLQWGICRGDSHDWNDYEYIITNRNACLSNRQITFQYSDQVVYSTNSGLILKDITGTNDLGESLTPQVLQTYYNGLVFKNWRSDAIITVYEADVKTEVDPSKYKANFIDGTLSFEIPVLITTPVTIIYPEKQANYYGEPTFTIDNKTYFAVNGRWPSDSEIVVLINGSITRGDYFLNREDGAVTFYNELERTDAVTVFVLPSNKFRIGVQLTEYDQSVTNTFGFALQYSTVKNANVFSSFVNTTQPYLLSVPEITSTSSAGSSISINERMTLSYNFYSPDGNREQKTQTKWYRYREVSGIGTTREVYTANSLPNYRNRTVERLADLNGADNSFIAGDIIYAVVSPSDGFKTGVGVTSLSVILNDNSVPYINNLVLTSGDANNGIIYDSTTGIYSMAAGSTIIASYDYYNGESASPTTINNKSIIKWFDKDKELSITSPTTTLSTDYIKSGSIVSAIVIPSDGVDVGLSVRSIEVQII